MTNRLCAAFLLLPFLLAAELRAGGGPENVLVVVNSESKDSKTIAEHYVKLRRIPACNVLEIPWDAAKETTDVATFREKLLGPALEAIRTRKLTEQIHCIAWSSDFPWRIDASADLPKPAGDEGKPRAPSPIFNPRCSLTALTFLHESTMAANSADYLTLTGNRYALSTNAGGAELGTQAFDGAQRFGPRGELTATDGTSYLLCVMLAVTAGRGNTVEEVLNYLDRAAQADGTQPKGTIYFCQNGDIRSTTRQRLFPAAVAELEKLGVKGEILQGVLPTQKDDVQGAMIGIAGFDWKASGSVILPGAICEHLTSYGGIMSKDAGQTPLSEFLRHGAAGASGTVIEPYAIAAKFPSPAMHVHYARGCTLAEAFYQSVPGPYHLLIVGDPLCRPWAKIPVVTLDNPPAGKVRGTLSLTAKVTTPDGGSVARLELFVDGLRHSVAKPGEPLTLDTATLGNGEHELRIVAIEASRVQSQGRQILKIDVENPAPEAD